MQQYRLVTIGGGSGQFTLLSGLRSKDQIDITSVVSMVDSGGSTGRLRDELGILPPGDILKCILALSPYHEAARTILLKRFKTDRRLKGHNPGNMLLTMLSRYTGSFPTGVQALAEILNVRGTILPVTLVKATLVAELTDGSRIYGENAIDIPRGNQREKIRNVFLVPHHHDAISVYPPVIEAIKKADYIVLGPGDLFSSIIPNLLVPGVKETLQKASAPLIYVINIMTKFGETHAYQARDFVATLEKNLGRQLDGIIYNTSKPSASVLEQYHRQKSDFVDIEPTDSFWKNRSIIAADLLDTAGGIVRHHNTKLADLIMETICKQTIKRADL
jgi:uncharacterized cofD-like protein